MCSSVVVIHYYIFFSLFSTKKVGYKTVTAYSQFIHKRSNVVVKYTATLFPRYLGIFNRSVVM